MKKRFVGLSVILLAAFAGLYPAQEKPQPVRANPALLVIDIQNAYLPRMSEQDKKMGMEMINHLVNLFRAHQFPIIRVYHTDPKYGPKPGNEEFEYPKTVAIKDEDAKIIKNYPSAFKKTELDKVLKEKDVNTLFLCGLSSVGCVIATFHGAMDLDYNVWLVEDALIGPDAEKTKAVLQIYHTRLINYFAIELLLENLANIEAAGRLQSESAAQVLESLIAARGLEAAIAEYRKTIAGNERYAMNETEMNALGYRYLQGGRTAEALAVFEINTETFPRSWNVWDSLAEACMNSGDMDKAEKYYQKSVELNPENQNGKDALRHIQGSRLNAAGETKETLRFDAGAQTGLQGPYLEQKPPGSRPEIFAPGIISSSKAWEFAVTFTPDGRELYFTRRRGGGQNTIMVSRWEKKGWTAPEEAAFAKGFPSNEPSITPDGRKLYFGCNRTRPGAERAEYGIWVVERTAAGGWSEPRYHGPGMYVSAARNGSLYMTDVTGIVSRSRPVIIYPRTGEGYGTPQMVGGGVNTPVVADHGFIAPDESYILFDSNHRPGGQGGEGDLYVCFRKADGSWGEAINLGDTINTPATNFCPSVSPDGRYIFFATYRDIYWVSAKILDNLKEKRKWP
jgi:nicotinamidase-related amidase